MMGIFMMITGGVLTIAIVLFFMLLSAIEAARNFELD